MADEPPIQDFDAFDQRRGNGVEVHHAVHVGWRGARAIDEHQRARGAEAAQVHIGPAAIDEPLDVVVIEGTSCGSVFRHGFNLRFTRQLERVLAETTGLVAS